jgi:hypothetical protein
MKLTTVQLEQVLGAKLPLVDRGKTWAPSMLFQARSFQCAQFVEVKQPLVGGQQE